MRLAVWSTTVARASRSVDGRVQMRIAIPSRRGPRRAACLVLALGLAAGLVSASYAVVERRQDAPTRQAARVLTFRAQPATRTLIRGATTTYRMRIGGYGRLVGPHGRRLPVRVWLSARKPLPRGVSATFGHHATRSSRATLTIRTTSSTRTGRYRLRLRARGRLGRVGDRRMRRAWTTVTLVVAAPKRHAFAISGRLTELLAPGRAVPLDLRLTNSRNTALRIRLLSVRVVDVRAPQADRAHPCTAGDFAVVQLAGSYGFRLPAHRSRSLSALGIASRRWPRVAMVNRPVNQDGCKRASLTLRFTGLATR